MQTAIKSYNTRLLVQLTEPELDTRFERLERRLLERVDNLPVAANDGPLDRAGAAKWLCVSMAKLDLLVRNEALPFFWLGDTKRFFRADLETYVRARKAKAA
jgi:hypothetical protein